MKTMKQVNELIDIAQTSGRTAAPYFHACSRRCDQSERRIDEYVPLSRASDGSIATQFTMTTLEELGLLKMDFLGLRTLTVIQNAVHLVEQDTGVKLDMQQIDYNDKKVLDSHWNR